MEGNNSLSVNAQKVIEDPQNVKYVSIASIWEIAIKISLEKLILKKPLENLLQELILSELKILPLTFAHILRLSKLEFFHKDPFDRIIISQAFEEELLIITKDPNFSLYNYRLYW